MGRPRDHGPVGGLFGDGLAVRVILVDHMIQTAHKVDGLKILPAAVLVGNPLAGFAGIVEIEHGSHRVDAQSIDVKFVEPKKRVADQKTLHFMPPIIENVAFPIRMVTLAWVGMFIEMGAVEIAEPMLVAGEMRRHPIENYADA